MKVLGAIELGGTKTVCALVTAEGQLLEKTQFPTLDPCQTFGKAIEFLRGQSKPGEPVRAVGVGSFGPIDRNPASKNYGQIGTTTKKGWSEANILQEIAGHIRVPVSIDTDVNCALLAEAKWGAGKNCDDVVYATIGTGIGAAFLSGGRLVNGQLHPEIGHMLIPAQVNDRDFGGSCPFHGSRCVEGQAAGPAITQRWGTDAERLSDSHPAWELEAKYLAVLCTNLFLAVAPQKIILGGGVMKRKHLFGLVRSEMRECLNGYINLDDWNKSLNDLIVPVALCGNAGVLGASIIAAGHCP